MTPGGDGLDLSELLQDEEFAIADGKATLSHDVSVDVAGLTADSRAVRPGWLFAALPGTHHDGRAFISDAVSRGAAAVLTSKGTVCPPGLTVPIIEDTEPRRRLALMAARFYKRQPATVAAVTGTNGKTSVVWLLRQIWSLLGHRSAGLGTLGIQAPDMDIRGSLTTPDPVSLHATLAQLAECGVDHLALEASSHGLDQYRLDGVLIKAAAFTNLSRDHLDYHGTMTAYRDAKLRLVRELLADDGGCVVNADSEHALPFAASATERGLSVLSYGWHGTHVRATAARPGPEGQALDLRVLDHTTTVTVPLVGDFQVSNVLCALALALATGAKPPEATATLPSLAPVPGRVERTAVLANGAAVYVDYAHTPDALATVLTALRPHTAGRLSVVFGCGGDRDAGKRPEMGAIAAALADACIVTDDNPRTEDAGTIRRQILAACPSALEIADRSQAIAHAIDALRAGDLLVVAGKGHETGQIVGDQVLPFDDAAETRRLVAEAAR